MTAILRQATRADIPGIWDVRHGVHENTLRRGLISDEDVRREIEDTGRGWVLTVKGVPSALGKSTPSPRQRRRICSAASYIFALFSGGAFSGRSTKSSGCQPEAMPRPVRPLVRLSITAHSSAIRAGWCSGATQLPARTPMRLVTAATAAPVTEGFG